MPVHSLILKGHNAFAIYEIGDDLGREPPTKRGVLFVAAPARAVVIESRFAADPW